MRLKKGFTLAEILIVLMVIGVIATLTIPSMMRGVQEAQLKAGYKKAFNTIANFASMERVAGALPGVGTTDAVAALYNGLAKSLSVKTFVTEGISDGSAMVGNTQSLESACMTVGTIQIGRQVTGGTGFRPHTLSAHTGATAVAAGIAWAVTEDNLAYTIMQGGINTLGGDQCSSIQTLANLRSDADAVAQSCAIVIVDVNGLNKAPNLFERQGLVADNDNTLQEGVAFNTITGDQFKIYLGIDGASAGPRTMTVTGRMMADIK